MEGPHGHDTFLLYQEELNQIVLEWRQREIDPLIGSVNEKKGVLSACG